MRTIQSQTRTKTGQTPPGGTRPRIAIALSVLLALSVLFAGCTDPSPDERYLLSASEIPSGLHMCEPGEEMAAFGITSNPARMPAEMMEDFADGDHGHDGGPVAGWVQAIVPTEFEDCDHEADEHLVLVMLMEWSSESGLQHMADEVSEYGCDEEGVYMDGKYVLMVESWGEESDEHLDRVRAAVEKKNPDMESICGTEH